MSAPLKPWERPGVNNQNLSQPPSNAMSSTNLPPCCQDGGGPAISSTARAPPPIPTRPGLQSSTATAYRPGYSGYGGIGSYGGMGYGGGMYGGYGNYGGMGSYSGMGYGGYNRMGYGGEQQVNNSFVQVAEESSRPAFQSIENIVQAVTSVSMMLDSTYQAVYNSFRAVLGVADNFSRMKIQLTQVLSALAIVRTLRYVFRRALVMLGLRPEGLSEDVWSEAADEAIAASVKNKKSKTSWPILMFFGIILGGPWLIWKLVSSVTKNTTQETAEWASGQDDHVVAKAEFNFNGDGNEELSFKDGETIIVAPRELQPRVRGWLLGCVDGQKVGYVPANYVKILGKRRGQKYQNSMSGQFLMEQKETNQSHSAKHSEQKPFCNGDDKADPVSTHQEAGFVSDEKLDSAFVSELPVRDILSDVAEMEASQVLDSQTGD